MIHGICFSKRTRSFIRGILIIFGLGTPFFLVHAKVTVNEIAWMGTTTSQYEEWIEFYNDGSEMVDLTGWKLFKIGETPLFSLSGSIQPGSYYLVCRSTISLTNPLGGICDEQGSFGGSGLNNTSDQLVLKDVSGAIEDTVDATNGWPAGDTTSKQTMQRSGDTWITAIGTPGEATVSEQHNPILDDDSSSDHDSDPVPPPAPKPTKDPKEHIEKIDPDPVYEAHVTIPDFATAGVSVPMKVLVKRDTTQQVIRGRFEWSMGDGGSYAFIKNTPVQHIYYHPGTYTVVMQYYSNRFKSEPDTIHRKTITIAPSDIIILGYSHDDGLRLKNESTKDIALDHWILQSAHQEFIFPKYTTISKNTTLSLSPRVIGISLSPESISLLNPSRELVARYSYHYNVSDQEKVFVDEPELQSTSPQITHSPLPESKTIIDLWDQNKWYVIFGGVVFISILAYLAFHLYAKRDELI